MSCILMALRFRRLGTSRKVDNSEAGVQKDMLKISKTILESPLLDKIASFDRATRAEINSLAVPGTVAFATILPLGHVTRAYEYLEQRTRERDTLINDFLADYERARADARSRLGTLYVPGDYPDTGKVQTQFGMSWNTYSLDTPSALAEINPQLYEQERQRYIREWEQAISAATEALTVEFQELLSHLIERLQPDSNGRAKTFRQSTVENFRDFLEKLQPRNIENNLSLAEVARECRQIIDTLDRNAGGSSVTGVLRQSASIRELVADGMSRARDLLDSAITSTPVRRIHIPDDDEQEEAA